MNPEPCPGVGLGFIPCKKSQNGIFWDGALVGAGSLKPKKSRGGRKLRRG